MTWHEFTERENAFIEGLVEVLNTSQFVADAEQAFGAAAEANFTQANDLREETVLNTTTFESYLDEAIERSRFGEGDPVVEAVRDGLLFARQLEPGSHGFTECGKDFAGEGGCGIGDGKRRIAAGYQLRRPYALL